ncbi:MAG: hypothetical protein K8R59_09295, partial [Thermoanaerobaculales bacterium]|nr:hypothetical protein [Thermoanaerobaculales bacterium]
MKRSFVALVVLLISPGVAFAAPPVVSSLQYQLKVQKVLQEENLAELERVKERITEAWTRVRRGSTDFLHAQRKEEDLESLRFRNEDLLQAEGTLLVSLFEAQRLRRSVLTTEAVISQTLAEIASMTGGKVSVEDRLSGTWKVVEEPGDREGLMYLLLDGTLVQGTYELDGGWSGSMRGTLVGDRIRLERIDSQLGFAAVYYGK